MATLLAAALAGCVGMPHDGPVVETLDEGNQVTAEGAPFINPLPPQAGQSRTEIVRGFLHAMQAWPSQTATARKFLTTDAAAGWNPQRETITYDSAPSPREETNDVVVKLADANHLDQRGAWQGPLPRARQTVDFPMVLEDGEWRIQQVPDALLVPQTWFADRYRQVSVYYFDPTASILTPEPVFVPRGDQLATSVTESLLMGPGPGLGQVEQTFVPAGLSVAVGVTVSADGVADVLLTGDAGQLSSKIIELMMAQFAWTLRQEPQVQSVRVSIGGKPVPLPGGATTYRIDGGAEYDPAGFRASPLLYGLRQGRLVSGTAAALDRVDGPLGTSSYGLRSVGVNLGATEAAGVTEAGTSVLLAPLTDAGKTGVREVAVGRDLLRPAWDFADRLWLVDRASGGARVLYADRDGAGDLTELRVPGITGADVRTFLISRDGSRLVAVVRRHRSDELVVSRIKHASTGRVTGAVPAERIDLGDAIDLPVRDVSWRSSTSLLVLNPQLTPSLAQVASASVDGAPANPDSAAIAVDGRIGALAGSPVPDEPIYGVMRTGLIDVTSSDRRAISFERPTRAVVYVG